MAQGHSASAGSVRERSNDERPRKRSIWPWLLALLLLAALVVGGFFLLGGDVDSDTKGRFDVDTPETDLDVDAPDVDAEAPDVDIDPGSVDVRPGDAEADAASDD